MNRLLIALLSLLLPLGAWGIYKVVTVLNQARAGRFSRELNDILVPPPGEPCASDRVLKKVTDQVRKLPREQTLWGHGYSSELARPPTREIAEADLEKHADLREAYRALSEESLEPPDEKVVLQVIHNFRDNRTVSNLIAEDILSLLVVSRFDEALELYRSGHRHARILGRGIGRRAVLIAAMIQIAQQGHLNRSLAHGLRHHLIPQERLPEWRKAVDEVLRLDIGLWPSMREEFDITERAVILVDRNLGLMAPLARLYWGNGRSQVQSFREFWKTETAIPESFLQRLHPLVQVGIPNFGAAKKRHRKRLAQCRGLRVAIALEAFRAKTGRYPTKIPGDDVEGSGPYRLATSGNFPVLYADGPNGEDDGGDDELDLVIWP